MLSEINIMPCNYCAFSTNYSYLFTLHILGNGRCAGKSSTYLAGESPVAEEVPASPYSESCVAGGNNSDEA